MSHTARAEGKMRASIRGGSALRHAFTLVELLVVVAVIAILLALLMPGLGNARETGRRVACAGNLKMTGTAFCCYTTESNSYLPPLAYGTSGSPVLATWYANLLSDGGYLPVKNWASKNYGDVREGVWRCPSAKNLSWGGGYGVMEGANNHWGLYYDSQTSARNISRIKRPSQLMLASDSRKSALDSDLTNISVWCSKCPSWDTCQQASLRHNGGSNICFMDFHVEWRTWTRMNANEDDIFGHSSW